jgi:hypothetical protein
VELAEADFRSIAAFFDARIRAAVERRAGLAG